MKNIFKPTLLLLCSVCLFTACDDDNDSNPVLLQPDTFVLNTPAYSTSLIELVRTTSIPFTWSQPDYGFPVSANYQMQVSLKNSFTVSLAESPVDDNGETNADYATLSTVYPSPSGAIDASNLLKTIIALGGWNEDNIPDQAQVYVRASASTPGASTIYSNVVNILVAPYITSEPTYAEFIYEIGNESGWTAAYPMRLNGDGTYQSYNYLNGAFKFKPNEGDWNGDWGQDPNGAYGDLVVDGEEDCNKSDGSFQDNLLDAGFYQINVDIVNMKWSVTAVEQVSVVGDFNSWGDNGDVDMTYNVTDGCWEVTTTVTDGGLKFRMNHKWDVSWGVRENNPDLNDLTQNDGKNISVTAGTYKFQLYLSYEGNNRVVITEQ